MNNMVCVYYVYIIYCTSVTKIPPAYESMLSHIHTALMTHGEICLFVDTVYVVYIIYKTYNFKYIYVYRCDIVPFITTQHLNVFFCTVLQKTKQTFSHHDRKDIGRVSIK
jgi:hypothetical protein